MSQISEKTSDSSSNSKEKYVWGISINVLLMGFVSLFTDVSSEMITAIMPVFILSIAAGNAIIALGFIDGISNAVANIIKGISGYLSDHLKQRKAFVIAGYALSNITKPFIGIQSRWEAVMALKVTDRIGKGIRVAPRDALISYYADKSLIELDSNTPNSGLNFGIHRTMDTIGAIGGALLAAILLFAGLNYSQVILTSIIPGLMAIFILFFVKDVKEDDILKLKAQKNAEKARDKQSSSKDEKLAGEKLSPKLKKLIISLSIMEFASVDIAFVMVRATDLVDAKWIILLYALFNVIAAFFATPLGKLSDRISKQKFITVGLGVLLFISIILALPVEKSGFAWVFALLVFPLFGLYSAIVEGGSKSFVSDITGKNKKGKIYGLYYFLVGGLSIPESLLFAWLYHTYGYVAAFSFSSILLAICIGIFARADFKNKE
jgi:MFS family permease